MAEFSFSEDSRGGVGMEIRAATKEEAFNAAATAMLLFMWDQETVAERGCHEIEWYGFNDSTAVVGLLSELLYRMEVDGWVFKRFELDSLDRVEAPEHENAGANPAPQDQGGTRKKKMQTRVRGRAWGEPHDPERHHLRFPVQAVLLPRLKLREVDGGWRLYCVLDA